MSWPTDDLSTDHLDAGADSPADARSMIKKVIDYLKAVLGARGAANGFCELDADAKVPPARIGRGAADGTAPLDAVSKLPRTHLPDATASAAGALRKATDAEAEGGTGEGAVTARQLARRTATADRAGLVEIATDTETITGTDTGRAVTPKNLKAALEALDPTEIRVATANSYTGIGDHSTLDRCDLAVATENGVLTITLTNHISLQRTGYGPR